MANRKEFHELIPIRRAEELLRSIIRSSTETVPLDLAYHSVLAEDVFAPIDVPSFDRADMDGYAVRAADTYRARERAGTTCDRGQNPCRGRSVAYDLHRRDCFPAGADAVEIFLRGCGVT